MPEKQESPPTDPLEALRAEIRETTEKLHQDIAVLEELLLLLAEGSE